MNVVLSDWQESAACAWCEKTRECVRVDFSGGFIKHSLLCWKCLQQAVKVDVRQRESASDKSAGPAKQQAANA